MGNISPKNRLERPRSSKGRGNNENIGTIYRDEQFASLYPALGSFAEALWRLVLVTIMQYIENSTDPQAA